MAGDIAQFIQSLQNIHDVLGSSPTTHKMGVVAHACIPSTQQVGVGGSGVHSPLWLYNEPGMHRALSPKGKEGKNKGGDLAKRYRACLACTVLGLIPRITKVNRQKNQQRLVLEKAECPRSLKHYSQVLRFTVNLSVSQQSLAGG